MSRRYQTRTRSCSALIIIFILVVVFLVLWLRARRPQPVAVLPTSTPTATFISREALALLPTSTPYLELPDLPTFTPSPTSTQTPTVTPTSTITPTPTATPAPTIAAQVRVELLNLRSGPGVEYDTVTILGVGEEVEVISRATDGEWVTVRLADGRVGWLLSDWLQSVGELADLTVITPPPTPTPTPEPPPQVAVDLANLRTGPGVAYEVITALPLGLALQPVGRNSEGDWIAVRTPEGEEGWLFIDLITGRLDGESLPIQEAPPSPTPLPPTPTSAPVALAAAVNPQEARISRLVLANYFTWYDQGSWDACNISAGDGPQERYHSDDPQAIARHIRLALNAGIDGFTLQWASPGDRTDRNFATLLNSSQGTDFRSTVVFLSHIWPGASYANTLNSLRHLSGYFSHPNFLKIDGRPVIFVTDVYRVPRGEGQSAQQAWASLRAQVDPNRSAWWIAEGLDPSFLSVFDGLWVYKVSHAAYPNDYVKASSWSGRVRSWQERTGQPKLWVGTLMPGWDDRNAGCRPDIRVPSQPFVRGREDGNFYRATYNAAVQSNPDILWIHSFNEWVEGTYIEPSRYYGETYLNLTRDLATSFKSGS